MKFLLIILSVLIVFVSCSKKIEQTEQKVQKEVAVTEFEPTVPFGLNEQDFFGEIKQRIETSKVTKVNDIEVYVFWLQEGDTLANIIWARWGKGKNIARAKKICEINRIENPNLIYCKSPIHIPVEDIY